MTSNNHDVKNIKKHGRFLYAKFQRSPEVPYVIKLLVRKHIAKDEAEARRLVVAVIIVILLISSYLVLKCASEPIFLDKINR